MALVPKNLKNILLGALILAAVFVAWKYISARADEHEERRRITALEKTAADAVESLPPGVEEAWLQYVDARMKELFEPRPNSVLIKDSLDDDGARMVSINMPYSIICSTGFGGYVNFGLGKDAVTVPIFGLLSHGTMRALTTRYNVQPKLEVSRTSKAAKTLTTKLCDRIDERMIDILRVGDRASSNSPRLGSN